MAARDEALHVVVLLELILFHLDANQIYNGPIGRVSRAFRSAANSKRLLDFHIKLLTTPRPIHYKEWQQLGPNSIDFPAYSMVLFHGPENTLPASLHGEFKQPVPLSEAVRSLPRLRHSELPVAPNTIYDRNHLTRRAHYNCEISTKQDLLAAFFLADIEPRRAARKAGGRLIQSSNFTPFTCLCCDKYLFELNESSDIESTFWGAAVCEVCYPLLVTRVGDTVFRQADAIKVGNLGDLAAEFNVPQSVILKSNLARCVRTDGFRETKLKTKDRYVFSHAGVYKIAADYHRKRQQEEDAAEEEAAKTEKKSKKRGRGSGSGSGERVAKRQKT
jgi:hypothetical protein